MNAGQKKDEELALDAGREPLPRGNAMLLRVEATNLGRHEVRDKPCA